jgi:hypothetical protein
MLGLRGCQPVNQFGAMGQESQKRQAVQKQTTYH